jgi:hypothetical protein
MSNKRRKQVRCTMCNQFSWMGNSKKKLRPRDLRKTSKEKVND